MESAGLFQDGRQRETWDKGCCAGAFTRRTPGISSRRNCPESFTAGWIQLGEPEEIYPPADIHRAQQLLLGDQIGWHCAQDYSEEFI